jgi:hypothetical protein
MVQSGSGTFTSGTGTVSLYGNVGINGAKTFDSGTGTVSIKGATTIADSTAFTVGSAGAGGTSTFYGNVVVGASGAGEAASYTQYGSFAQNDENGATSAFTTASGTVSIKGHTTVATGKNLHMTASGAGTFQTGTGQVTLNGNTAVSTTKEFETGTGTVSLKGTTHVADDKTFSVGSAGSASASQFFGGVYVGGSAGGNSAFLTVYGDTTIYKDGGGQFAYFKTTATDSITLSGDVTVAANKNLHMADTGDGTFQTGTGPITLNGDVTVSGTKSFTINTYTNEIVCSHAAADLGDTFCKATR